MNDTNAAAPVNNAQAILGSIMVRVSVHWTKADTFVLQARDVRFNYPRAENVQAAMKLLGIFPGDDVAIEGNPNGLFARVELTEVQIKAGNGIARWLAEGAEEKALAAAVAVSEAAAEA